MTRRILHIQTQADALASDLIAAQRAQQEFDVEVVTLHPDSTDDDYNKLVERIFAVDTIAVW